jgi:hypothetical protein
MLYNIKIIHTFCKDVTLGGLIVRAIVIGPKVAGSNSAEDDIFLRAIKIRSTTFFGGEVKPSFI